MKSLTFLFVAWCAFFPGLLVELTLANALETPSVLLVEDVHWADSTTLEVLDMLVERVRDLPLLIVITHRQEFADRWSGPDNVSLLHLARLSAAEGEALATNLAGGKALPRDLIARILDKTDGVPLFVEELTKSILESGALREGAESYDYSGDANEVTIPATLRDLMMERLDRFKAAKEIAQIGSAIGRTFRRELLVSVASMPAEKLNEALRELTDAGLATKRGEGDDASYTFKHALLHDTAYDSLLKSRRQKLHERIARVLEADFPQIVAANPESLARHYSLAGMHAEAVPHWQTAGESAMRRMAMSDAIASLDRGLTSIAELPRTEDAMRREIALRRALGTSWMAARGWPAPEVRESLMPALDIASAAASPRDLLAVYYGIWSNTLSGGRVAESAEWGASLLAIAEEHGDEDLAITANLMLCVSHFWRGELKDSQRYGETVVSLYDPVKHHGIAHEINSDPSTGAGVYLAQISWMLGYPDRAVAEFEANIGHARARGHIFNLGFSLAAGADIFEYRGEPEAQRKHVEKCRDLGREHSLEVLSGVLAPLRHGASLIRAGAWRDGCELLEEGLSRREAGGGFGGSNPYHQTLLAEGLAEVGELDRASAIIERQIEQIHRPGWGEKCHYAEVLRIRGLIADKQGDAAAAEEHYRASIEWARTQDAKSWELRSATSLASLLHADDRSVEAASLLDPLLDWFAEGGDTRDHINARDLRGRLAESA